MQPFSNAGIDDRMNVSYYRGKDKQRRVESKMSANPKLAMTNAFGVLDRIPEKKRGTGVILCMYHSPLWLKDNIQVKKSE